MRRQNAVNWSNVKKTISNLVATLFFIGGLFYWYEIMQHIIVPNSPQNIAFLITSTLVCAGVPPVLLSMVVPWSPLGKWMSREFLKTWGGFIAIIMLFLGLMYYFEMSLQWWYHQPAAQYDLLVQQVIVGFIGFYIIPAITMQTYRTPDVLESMEHARSVQRVELATDGQILRLRQAMMTLSQAQSKGYDNLSPDEMQIVVDTFTTILKDMDVNVREMLRAAGEVTGVVIPFAGIFVERPELVDMHAIIEETLLALPEAPTRKALVAAAEENPEVADLLAGLLDIRND